jgi:hypothetical protein
MDCMLDVFIHSDVDTDESVVAMHAAHAINHADSLANALEALIAAVECNELLNSDFNGAKSALAVYRGEA